MSTGAELELMPRSGHVHVAAGGVRFSLYRADPPRSRRTTPTLLLHGVPQTAACWRDVVVELARDRVVLAPDLKGLGGSEMTGRYDVATLVAELTALVLHEVDGPVDVVGHDWGGTLAIALAAERPELVRRFVVVNAPYRRLNLLRAWHVPVFAAPVLPELAFRAAGRTLVTAMLRAGWRKPTRLDPLVARHYVDAYADPARVGAMLAYYRANARPRLGAVARELLAGPSGLPPGAGPLAESSSARPDGPPGASRGPAAGSDGEPTAPGPSARRPQAERQLVVWGARDPVLPLSIGESVVRDLGAETGFVTVPGAGHFVVEEAPDVVVPAIASFLRAGGLSGKPRAPRHAAPAGPEAAAGSTPGGRASAEAADAGTGAGAETRGVVSDPR